MENARVNYYQTLISLSLLAALLIRTEWNTLNDVPRFANVQKILPERPRSSVPPLPLPEIISLINREHFPRTARRREMRSKYRGEAIIGQSATLIESLRANQPYHEQSSSRDTSVTPCVPGLSGQPCAFLKEGKGLVFPL